MILMSNLNLVLFLTKKSLHGLLIIKLSMETECIITYDILLLIYMCMYIYIYA